MLNSSIESAVTASSARRPSEKAASAPAEPATSETEVSVRSFSKRSWLSGPAGGKKELVGCRCKKRLCQWERERTQVGSSRHDHQYPFQYTVFLRHWERRRDQWGTSTEASTPICFWSRNRQRFRSVINLRGLNSYTKKLTFIMATLKDASQSIRKWDWAATIDLKDAYLHVPIARVTATSCLNKEGRTRSVPLNRLPLDILIFCQNHEIFLIPTYLPGVANLSVDPLSRGQESKEWFLDPQVANRIHRWISSHHASPLIFQYISPYTERPGEQRDQCSGLEVEVQKEVCVFTSSTDSV